MPSRTTIRTSSACRASGRASTTSLSGAESTITKSAIRRASWIIRSAVGIENSSAIQPPS